MAAVGTLVGNLLSRDARGDHIGLVGDLLGRGPDGLPVYMLKVYISHDGERTRVEWGPLLLNGVV